MERKKEQYPEAELIFIAYYDEKDNLVEGKFPVCEKVEGSHIKIETYQNFITIPWHRILKIKELKV